MIGRSSFLVALGALLTTGCAEPLTLLQKPAGDLPLTFFWPPPEATSIWASELLAEAARGPSFGDAARRVAGALDGAGYRERHFCPIGVRYLHGFAVTTRLEQVDEDDAAPKSRLGERGFARFPEAPTLRWLEGMRALRLPAAGRYRIFLVAFTDLPLRHEEGRAWRWDEGTVMEAPSFPPTDFPGARTVPEGYRLGVFVYEYASSAADGEGTFLATDETLPAATHVQMSGLSRDPLFQVEPATAR